MGVDWARRGRIADANLDLLLRLLAGGPVDVDGRRVHVTPGPATKGGPRIMIAGGSPAAARRAGRHGLGFIAYADTPGLRETFEAESLAHGHQPGPVMFPDEHSPTAVFVADDVDAAWAEIGPFLLHDAAWPLQYRQGDESVASITRARTVDEMRSAPGPYGVMTVDDAAARIRAGASLPSASALRRDATGGGLAVPRTSGPRRVTGARGRRHLAAAMVPHRDSDAQRETATRVVNMASYT